ncbi:MAG: hypothetical protein MRY78_19400 [Saprospiraceae bacterium]|nr:hypothetical protein [Saprospiraceae bacterium]
MLKLYKHALVLFLLVISISSFAQPTLTVATQTPEFGETYKCFFLDQVADGFNPGIGGPDQLWDFTEYADLTTDTVTFSILDPQDAPAIEDYPDADFVWLLENFNAYNYYKIDEDTMGQIGSVLTESGQVILQEIFEDQEEGLQFPMTFGTTYEYFSASNLFIAGIPFGYNETTATVEVDGYGSVATPFGTFTDVIRVVVTASNSGTPGEIETQISWIQPGVFVPLCVFTTYNTASPASLYFAAKIGGSTTATTNLTNVDFGVSLQENPAREVLQLNGLENIPQNAHLYLVGRDGKIRKTEKDSRIEIPDTFKGLSYLLIKTPDGQQTLPFIAL